MFFHATLPLLLVGAVLCQPTVLKRQATTNGTTYSRLVVFGESSSDDGHGAWISTNYTYPDDPAYYRHSFTNGLTWGGVLASNFSLDFVDRSTGGATTDNDFVQGGTGPSFNIQVNSTNLQIEAFLANDSFTGSDIVGMLIGVNDILFNTSTNVRDTLFYLGRQMLQLQQGNASTVVLLSYPDLLTIPGVPAGLNASAAANVSRWAEDFAAGLDRLAIAYRPLMNVIHVNVYDLSQKVAIAPELYGFNASYVHPQMVECLYGVNAGQGPRTLCDDPEQHVYFDPFDPSSTFHNLIAGLIADTLGWTAS